MGKPTTRKVYQLRIAAQREKEAFWERKNIYDLSKEDSYL